MKKIFSALIVLLFISVPLWAGPKITSQPTSSSSSIGAVVNNMYALSLSDDSTYTLPTHTYTAFGIIVVGDDDERAIFSVDSAGTVHLISSTPSIIVNGATDAYFLIGTSVANPVILKNRLGSTKTVLLNYWYN